MPSIKSLLSVCAVTALVAGPALASRSFHTFIVSEVYSSADGSVQFIELKENLNFGSQNAFMGHTLTATSADGLTDHVFTFATNLPSTATAGKRVLIATAGFGSLPGGVTPDFILQAPVTLPFIFPGPTGGAVNFAGLGGGANVIFTSLPTNGLSSRNFPGGTVANNTPTNFAGQVGSVNIPSGSCCVGAVCNLGTAIGCSAGTFNLAGTCTPTNPCAPPPTGACCTGASCAPSTVANCTGASTYQGNGSACGPVGNPTTCCRANFNMMAGVTVQDIFDFLAAYFQGDGSADFNGVGGITVQDIFDYLAAYFAGCA